MSFIVIAVVCLIISVGMIYFNFHNAAELNAYRTATACASPADALNSESCRYTGAATVVGSSRQKLLSLELRFDGLAARAFTATFATGREPDAASASTGAQETGELWNGHVIKFAGGATTDDPEFRPPNLLIGGIFFGAAFGLMLFWGLRGMGR